MFESLSYGLMSWSIDSMKYLERFIVEHAVNQGDDNVKKFWSCSFVVFGVTVSACSNSVTRNSTSTLHKLANLYIHLSPELWQF